MKYNEFLLERNLIDVKKNLRLIKEDDAEAKKIANALNIHYNGYWPEAKAYIFTDDKETGSSFLANTLDEAKNKLKEKRKSFKVKHALR